MNIERVEESELGALGAAMHGGRQTVEQMQQFITDADFLPDLPWLQRARVPFL